MKRTFACLLMPVSYTHLDVYKRQVYQGRRNATVNDMLIHGRVHFVAPTDYTQGSEMENIIFGIFDSVAAESRNIALNRRQLDEAQRMLEMDGYRLR